MFMACSTGLGTVPALPRFGGGAEAPVAAIPIPVMLGAGASGAAAGVCKVGAVPPLTTSGDDLADAVLSGSVLSDPLSAPDPELFPAAGGADPTGLVEDGVAASGDASSLLGLVDGLAMGCEPFDVESVGAVRGAVDVAGMLLAVGLGTTDAGFVAGGTGTGWLTVPLYCVQP